MPRASRVPLLTLLALVLASVGFVSSLSTPPNPSSLPSGLVVSSQAESTALYCTGLSSVRDGVAGRVIFLNTTAFSRTVTVHVVSDTAKAWSKRFAIAAHASQAVLPVAVLTGHHFAVAAQVSGGGVVAEEVTATNGAQTPCIATGVTDWYGAGFDTTVGSRAALSIYNPTATAAVLNVSTYSKAGFVAPAKFQGISIGPHAQVELNLGDQIVSLKNVGVRVRVVRGAVVIVGVQQSGATVSFNAGLAAPSTSAEFPRVTTANKTTVQVRVANPGPTPANVTVDISLAKYRVAAQKLTIAPYTSAYASITPNPAVPIAGYASVRLTSNWPVVAALAAGPGRAVALSSPGTPESAFLVSDFTGLGFDAATVTNTSSKPVAVAFTTSHGSNAFASTTVVVVTLAPGLSANLARLSASPPTMRATTVLVNAARPVLLVTLTLPTNPAGIAVVAALDGR